MELTPFGGYLPAMAIALPVLVFVVATVGLALDGCACGGKGRRPETRRTVSHRPRTAPALWPSDMLPPTRGHT